MFEKVGTRLKIALVWLLSFIFLWILFNFIFPLKTMNNQLSLIEQSINSGDWQQANDYTNQFVDTFEKKKFLIQMNNATEAFTNFEHTIGQLNLAVKHNNDSSIEYVGALKETLNLTVKPFAGP